MKILGPDDLTGDFTKCLKNTGKKKKQKILQNLLYEVKIILILNLHKTRYHTNGKLQINISYKYRHKNTLKISSNI